ncbi:MAG: indole-3-glycerol-phosphate synthase [Thaumarchaeota archaeon]|nr:indole-3-glycerol-phosphate synthase [Nitrososphaerota archaeon]
MRQGDESFVAELAASARKTIGEGYYNLEDAKLPHRSMVEAIAHTGRTPVIAEVKFRSPAEGSLRSHSEVAKIAEAYQRGGVAGISVLAEPKHFEGRLEYVTEVKRSVTIPVLMKDIVIDPIQISAAALAGADVILLMASIFAARLSKNSLGQMVDLAHEKGLEVLLEAHTEEEYIGALQSGADLVGINNRNLHTLEVSLDTSRRLLRKNIDKNSKPVVCESGISKRSEILELSSLGADGFLVGSAIMKAKDLEQAVRNLTGVQ